MGDRMGLFVGSDFASKATDRRSVSGVVMMLVGAYECCICVGRKRA